MTLHLTRQEAAYLKTALACVVIRRRRRRRSLLDGSAAGAAGGNNNDDDGDGTRQDAVVSSPQQKKRRSEAWAPHLTHMMEMALKNKNRATTTTTTIATHIACQLYEWLSQALLSSSPSCLQAAKEWMTLHLQQQEQAGDGGTSTTSTTSIWEYMLRAEPRLAEWMVPILLSAIRNNNNNNNHHHATAWNLLHVAVSHVPIDLVHETIQTLVVEEKVVPQAATRVEDLAHAFQCHQHGSSTHTNGRSSSSSFLWTRWAKADLLQRLLARLQDEEEQYH